MMNLLLKEEIFKTHREIYKEDMNQTTHILTLVQKVYPEKKKMDKLTHNTAQKVYHGTEQNLLLYVSLL